MNAIASPSDFQARMFERIKSQIGELMTDDELKKVVDAAMQKAFFEPSVKVINPGSYQERKELGPPHISLLLEELLKDQVKVLMQQWIAEHEAEVLELINKHLEGGMAAVVGRAIQTYFGDALGQFQYQLIEQIRSLPR